MSKEKHVKDFFTKASWLLYMATDLNSTERDLWIALSLFSDQDNAKPVWPSVGMLAKMLNCSENTIRTTTKGLETKGFVKVERDRKDENGTPDQHLYKLTYPDYLIELGEQRIGDESLRDITQRIRSKGKGSNSEVPHPSNVEPSHPSKSEVCGSNPEAEQDINKRSSKTRSNQQDICTLTSTDTSVSMTGQKSILGGFTKTPVISKPTKMQRALDKIEYAQKTHDWSQIKDQDWMCYFISQHNKTLPRPLTMGTTSGWETAVFREHFMNVYNIPRDARALDFINLFIQKYRTTADPKYRDQITFNLFSNAHWLADDIMQKVREEQGRRIQEERKKTQKLVNEVF